MKRVLRLFQMYACLTLAVVFGVSCWVGGASRAEAPEEVRPKQVEAEQADPVSAPTIQLEAILVQLDRAAAEEIEKITGLKLGPEPEQVVLTPQKAEELLAVIEHVQGARIVASSSTKTASGEEAQIKLKGELIFSPFVESLVSKLSVESGGSPLLQPGKEFVPPPSAGSGRPALATAKVRPMVTKYKEIALVAECQLSILIRYKKREGSDALHPLYSTWSKTTSLIIPDGSSFILKESFLRPASPQAAGEETPEPGAEKPESPRQQIMKKLEIIVPEIHFEDAKLTEVVNYLSRESGLNMVIDPAAFTAAKPGADGKQVPIFEDTGITVRLRNAPLKEVLKYILKSKRLKYDVEDYAVLIAPEDYVPPESLHTQVFQLKATGEAFDRETIVSRLAQALGVSKEVPSSEPARSPGADEPEGQPRPEPFQTEVLRLDTRNVGVVTTGQATSEDEPEAGPNKELVDLLRNGGIPWPRGSNIVYDEKTKALVVTNSEANLALIRELVSLSRGEAALLPPLLNLISARIISTQTDR